MLLPGDLFAVLLGDPSWRTCAADIIRSHYPPFVMDSRRHRRKSLAANVRLRVELSEPSEPSRAEQVERSLSPRAAAE